MASIIPKTYDQKQKPLAAFTQSGMFRNQWSPVGNTDLTGNVPGSKATTSQSSSELGLPGGYPREPRVALDHLSDKAENGAEDTGTIFDSAAEDLRNAIGAASRYLQDSVSGAVDSIIPSESADIPELDGNESSGNERRSAVHNPVHRPQSRFNKADTAVAGIASEFTPSSSKAGITESAADGPSTPAKRNSRFVQKDLAIGGIASDFTPSSSKSRIAQSKESVNSLEHSSIASGGVPSTEADEPSTRGRSVEPAFVSYAPGPVVTDHTPSSGVEKNTPMTQRFASSNVAQALNSTVPKAENQPSNNPFASSASVPASKEKKDDDVAVDSAASVLKSKDSDGSSDLRKRTIQTSAIGAGVGTLGGAAYQHRRSGGQLTTDDETQPPSKGSRLAGARQERQPAFASYAAAPIVSDIPTPSVDGSANDSAKPGAGADDLSRPDGKDDESSERKRVIEVVALGAGIGTVGGAAYANSPSSSDKTPSTGASRSEAVNRSKRVASTGDARAPSTSATRDEGYHSEGEKHVDEKDLDTNSGAKQGLVGAVGVGAGALGGSALAKSHAPGNTSTASAAEASPTSLDKLTNGTRASVDKNDPAFTSATVEEVSPSGAVNKVSDSARSKKDDNSEDSASKEKSKEGLSATALGAGAGAGILGGAAYATSRGRGQSSPETSKEIASDAGIERAQASGGSTTKPVFKADTNNAENDDTANSKSSDSDRKKGFSGAALGMGAMLLGSVAYSASHHDSTTDRSQAHEANTSAANSSSKPSKDVAEAAGVGAGAGDVAGAAAAHSNRFGEKEAKETMKQEKKRNGDVATVSSTDGKNAKETKGLKESAEEEKRDSKSNNALGAAGAAGGAVVGAGFISASTDGIKQSPPTSAPFRDPSGTQWSTTEPSEIGSVHPSKAASAPPHRPGLATLGAAGPNDKPKSGADSDFFLPAEDANDTTTGDANVGSGGQTGVAMGGAESAGGLTAGESGTDLYRPRSRYYGTEGLQEKQQGGALRSSTIENMKHGAPRNDGPKPKENSKGNGNGNGKGKSKREKKEGFVKHLVGKVKDKLHHHDK